MKRMTGVLAGLSFLMASSAAPAAIAGDKDATDDFFKEMPLQSQSAVMLFDMLNEYNFYNGERTGLDPKDRTIYGADFFVTGRGPNGVVGSMNAMTCEHILKEGGRAAEETLRAFFHAVDAPLTPDVERQIRESVKHARDVCMPAIS